MARIGTRVQFHAIVCASLQWCDNKDHLTFDIRLTEFVESQTSVTSVMRVKT